MNVVEGVFEMRVDLAVLRQKTHHIFSSCLSNDQHFQSSYIPVNNSNDNN